MYPIRQARRDRQDETIVHELDSQPDQIYKAILAGLSWPHKGKPGYFCIFGLENLRNEFKKLPVRLIDENECTDLEKLFLELVDSSKMVMCEDVFADLNDSNECYREAFSNFCSDTGTSGIYLLQAPHCNNFEYGTALIKEALKKKALIIEPNTLLAKQLGLIPENFSDQAIDPALEFWRVNALRHVMAVYSRICEEPITLPDLDFGPWERWPGWNL